MIYLMVSGKIGWYDNRFGWFHFLVADISLANFSTGQFFNQPNFRLAEFLMARFFQGPIILWSCIFQPIFLSAEWWVGQLFYCSVIPGADYFMIMYFSADISSADFFNRLNGGLANYSIVRFFQRQIILLKNPIGWFNYFIGRYFFG